MAQMQCPQCNKAVDMSAQNSWRPFCSERCKLIDLGAWASGRYSIAAEDAASSDELEALERPSDPRHHQ